MTKHYLSRRRFLQLTGILGSAVFLQACQNAVTPSATLTSLLPTPTGTRRPTGTPRATATTVPTTTDTPAAIDAVSPVSPVVEPTPVPLEPSPTPVPTPYPPGDPSKLGVFLTRFDSQALNLIEQGKPPLIKTLELDANFAKGIKELSPDTILIGRMRLGQMNLDAEPLALARQFVDELLPLAADPVRLAAFDAWEAYNEPVADTPDKMKRLADFEAERTRLLAAEGIRSVVGNFATGHPPLELWSDFAPALDAIRQHNGFLGLHEYSAPIMQFGFGALQADNGADQGDEGWLTGRYRKAYRQYLQPMGYGDTPLLITECGVDGLVGNRPGPADALGWHDFVSTWLDNGLRNDPPGVYMDQLIWYDGLLQQDDFVKGAAIFVLGASPGWESYDISGRTADLLLEYLMVHPPRG